MKRHAPAADRNKGPILEQLTRLIPKGAAVLEVAAGTGQHAVHFAQALDVTRWQPTDLDPEALTSIEAYRAEAGLDAIEVPVRLDVTCATPWPGGPVDAVVAINLLHIAPWRVAEGLFQGAGRELKPGGLLITYGPYRFHGAFTAPTNREFDQALRLRDPEWGVRDVDALGELATSSGLDHLETVSLPANNHLLVFKRVR